MTVLILKLAFASHILFAALFVGGNVFLDFILTPRLDLIPPGQAARLGEKMGNDFAIYNWVCLIGLLLTGPLLAWRLGIEHSLITLSFYKTSYGAGLLAMESIWATLVVTGSIMTFYLRPRLIVKLPYNAGRDEITADRDASIRYADWMRWL